jgi:phenylacetate-CoA ligase
MGRADQRTKVKGMFVDPKQIAAIVERHPGITKARLVVARDGEQDSMALHIEAAADVFLDEDAIAATLADVTKLRGTVVMATQDSLPNDGKVIADEREYSG